MAASDPAIRQVYLDLAQQWRQLAEHIEAGQDTSTVRSQSTNPLAIAAPTLINVRPIRRPLRPLLPPAWTSTRRKPDVGYPAA
jgi:hypothetical protein